MTAAACPVSWLRLERYQLGELEDDEHMSIRSHLDGCADCRAALQSIESDMRELPRLPLAPAVIRPRRWWLPVTAGAVAMAAAVLLFLRRPPPDDDRDRAKGAEVLLTLVREDDGDRYKALVTCPPSMSNSELDVVVYDEGGVSFPLEPAMVACGNSVPLPGAFRLTGDMEGKATVCVVWQTPRVVLQHTRPETLPRARCQVVR